MTKERLEEIKKSWIDDGNGLAIVGNASYRMVAELIEAVEAEQSRHNTSTDGK